MLRELGLTLRLTAAFPLSPFLQEHDAVGKTCAAGVQPKEAATAGRLQALLGMAECRVQQVRVIRCAEVY